MKSVIDAMKPAAKRYIVWDERLKGFGLRVESSGVKTYLVRYRTGVGGRKGVAREFKIGRVGDPGLAPDEARRRAEHRLAEAKLGNDPQGELARRRAEVTVAEFCDWYQDANPAGKKASTRAVDKVRIERHIKPFIGALRLSEVHRADI